MPYFIMIFLYLYHHSYLLEWKDLVCVWIMMTYNNLKICQFYKILSVWDFLSPQIPLGLLITLGTSKDYVWILNRDGHDSIGIMALK